MQSKDIAGELLKIKAIKLNPAKPFVWASGWKSPIYCDNRKTLSFPKVRTLIKEAFVSVIKEKYPDTEVIAGITTGAIAQGALVAEAMNLPFVYIRSSAKKHGMTNIIEGELKKGQKVVVIEDLVSTGGSSLKAVNALRNSEAEVLGMIAVFSYGFKIAENNFSENNCELTTLSNYETMINIACETNYIKENEIETLKLWREKPESWGK